MASKVIQVDGLSKLYRLGEVGSGTLSQDLKRWWHKVQGKEDTYLKIGEKNDRTVKSKSDLVWALKDISFNVSQGEIVGIIGRNGAGKSTLLKILSRTTSPTSGSIKIKGRVASLLEVGTGFHPELTGRDNIYLNGAILGMNKQEIRSKFDAIVEFAGVEKYIDTPVKRYSSGMYVRLAFAVAAHLDSDILIIDEVLAVGDMEFQKRCLGKMKEVTSSGQRTVLFVSHNMDSVSALCNKGILISAGHLHAEGEIESIIKQYLDQNSRLVSKLVFDEIANLERIGPKIYGRILSLTLLNSNEAETTAFEFEEQFRARIDFQLLQKAPNAEIGIAISNSRGQRFHHFISTYKNEWKNLSEGYYTAKVVTGKIRLYPGKYSITVWFRPYPSAPIDDLIEGVTNIEIVNKPSDDVLLDTYRVNGGVLINNDWTLLKNG